MSEEKEEEKSPVEKYLQKIKCKAGGHDCIYRGLPNAEWRSENAAQRRIREVVGAAVEKTVTVGRVLTPPKGSLTSYHKNLLDDARHKGFGIRDGRRLSDLELLTDLQHLGAATCLLDFTESPLVALYFACANEKEKQEDGKLSILRNANLNNVFENYPIEEIIESGDLLQWRPPMHGEAERRIIRQSGVFIINLNFKEEKEERLFEIEIAQGDKESILDELRNNYQISADTLFIDLAGFAKNQSSEKPLPESLGAFYRGNASANRGRTEAAIKYYNKAISLNPDYAEAYYGRGVAKFGSAVKIKKNANLQKKYWNKAIADFTEAIRLRPTYAEAHRGRGVTKGRKRDWDEAIEDYDKAIRLNPDYAEAYYGRGIANENLGNINEAEEDGQKALSLAQEQNLSKWIRQAEKLLERL